MESLLFFIKSTDNGIRNKFSTFITNYVHNELPKFHSLNFIVLEVMLFSRRTGGLTYTLLLVVA